MTLARPRRDRGRANPATGGNTRRDLPLGRLRPPRPHDIGGYMGDNGHHPDAGAPDPNTGSG